MYRRSGSNLQDRRYDSALRLLHSLSLKPSDGSKLNKEGSLSSESEEEAEIQNKPVYLEEHFIRYEPLDLDTDAIRLLRILPDEAGKPIRCTLRNTMITAERYTCLSYAWQPDYPRRTIEVDGAPLIVSDNLFQFLTVARKFKIVQPLWIDAVCLNQADTREKNHQV
ncbi:hypothetical protein BU23DRAFT_637603 [Bimuria novae-zelandiae CBS 107.79]|uniref:Heterokaryon incompatibility domain-containing protein n=1 Tax=Bimuria novae-zelandiae CBS 107.79 TaxID=1447943 RepID=A0A6A5VTN9_9PLEO|nr:hypothetical protein BU23DRAFT_637603 [Bimuria novae-zelandiae CBS 107.79]